MKIFKIFLIPFLFLNYLFISSLFFQSCNPDDCEDENQEETCDTCLILYKPNIYIYPEEETFLNVTLEFPEGGKVIASIPEYGNGWDFTVNTDGIIDNEYEFLFYESIQPNVWQLEKGWCISIDSLSEFFTTNLTEYGFEGREIDDFIEYWIPRFQTSGFYIIYPQIKTIIDSVVELHISQEPDNVLRLFYLVENTETDKSAHLIVPEIEEFSRTGFFITEWGVILK